MADSLPTTSRAGQNIIEGTSSNEHLNGGARSDYLDGAGNDRIGGGAGDDTVDGGAGSDIVKGDAGSDAAIYVAAENLGATDVYDGGSGVDTLRLVLTRDEWMNAVLQQDVADYLEFIAENTLRNGETKNTEFQFTAFDLRVSRFEQLEITVDGIAIDPRDQAVTLAADAVVAGEDSASIAVDVLANDSVPDLIRDIEFTQPSHGTITLVEPSLSDPASPPKASFIYTPHPTHWQYLAAGESAVDSFTYTVTDANGDVSVQTVAVTVIGANDAPAITSGAQAGVVDELAEPGEGGTLSAAGTILFTDADLSDDHVSSIEAREITASSLANGYVLTADQAETLKAAFEIGAATSSAVDGAGLIAWTYAIADGAVDFLGDGDSVTLTFTVKVDDGNGGADTQDVVITVNGANDAPVITTGHSAEIAELPQTTNGVIADPVATGGSLVFADADLTDAHTVGQSLHSAVWSGGPVVPALTMAALAGAFSASLADSSTGDGAGSINWSFSIGNPLLDFLAEGETLTLVYHVSVQDSRDAADAKPVTITIRGANDFPIVEAVDGDTAGHLFSEADVGLTKSGTLTVTDRDLTDTVALSVSGAQVVSGSANGMTADQLLSFFSITSTSSPADEGATSNLDWTFHSGSEAFDYLGNGESLVLLYTINAQDDSDQDNDLGLGTVTITIQGTNDAPVITSPQPIVQIGEQAGAMAASGTIFFEDADTSDQPSALAAGFVITQGDALLSNAQRAALASAFSVTDTGQWAFSVDGAAFQSLPHNGVVEIQYAVTVRDAAFATDTQNVIIRLAGDNDSPAALADVNGADVVQEQGYLVPGDATASGNVLANDSDIDLGDTRTVVGVATDAATGQIGAAIAGTYGALTMGADGQWTYALDNADPDTEALAAGATVLDAFTYTISDAAGATSTATLSITIDGAGDNAPPVAQADSFTVQEDEAATLAVLANDSDGNGQTLSVGRINGAAIPVGDTVATSHGTLTVEADGALTYIANAHYSGADSFTYEAFDGLEYSVAESVSIIVAPVNDAPAIDLNGAGAGTGIAATYVENAAPVLIAPMATVSDIDTANLNGGSLTVAFTGSYSENVLSIRYSGNGAGQIGVSGNTVSYGSAAIGTFSSSVNGSPLVIAFTGASVTQAAAEALVRSIQYHSISDNPSTIPWDISFRLVDGDGTAAGGVDTGLATASLTTISANDAPTAVSDSGSTNEDTAITLNVLSNDSDVDGDILAIFGLSDSDASLAGYQTAQGATISIVSGQIVYDPTEAAALQALNAGAAATDSFSYTVSDGKGGMATTTATVSVAGVTNTQQVMTFDDLNVPSSTGFPQGYHGFGYSGGGGIYRADNYGFNWPAGDASPPNAVFNYGDASLFTTNGSSFDFVGAYLVNTQPSQTPTLTMTVRGYEDGVLEYQSAPFTLSSSSAVFQTFNFLDVDRLEFDVSSTTAGWAMDNITIMA